MTVRWMLDSRQPMRSSERRSVLICRRVSRNDEQELGFHEFSHNFECGVDLFFEGCVVIGLVTKYALSIGLGTGIQAPRKVIQG